MISRIPIFPGDTILLMSQPMSGCHFDECILVKTVRRVGDIFNDSGTFIVTGMCEHGLEMDLSVSADLRTVGMPAGFGYSTIPGLSVELVPATAL